MSKNEALSIHIVGDAFADLFCFLENGLPVPGGDSRLSCPIKTMAGGSAVNTTTHLTALLRSFCKENLAPPQVKLHTSVNPNDEYGKMLLNHATKHGFPLLNCKRQDSERATGHCVVIVTDDDRSFMTHQGCMHDFEASDLNVDTLVNAPTDTGTQHSHVHVAGYYNIPGFWNGKLQEILERVRQERENLPHQTTTTISVVPQHDATEEWDGGLLDLLSVLDFVIMNELEADCISRRRAQDSDDETQEAIQHWASFFASASPKTYAIVTRGPHGAVALQYGKVVATQSAVAVQVVDPTGAGDAFAAGFLHGLWNWRQVSGRADSDWPVEAIQQGLFWGCAVASCSVLTRGASVPSQVEQIQEFLDKATQQSL